MADPTPGEWEAIRPKRLGKHWRIVAHGTLGGKGAIGAASVLRDVAAINNGAPGDTLDTEEANARLMAASKLLLAACRALVAACDTAPPLELIGHVSRACEQARAAVALAEGKS